MDSDTEDGSNSTGSSFVLRVAGLATLQQMWQVPARVFSGKLGRESQNNPVKKKPCACATVQLCHATREVVGTDEGTFREPFAALSRAFAHCVFASCVPVLIQSLLNPRLRIWLFGIFVCGVGVPGRPWALRFRGLGFWV